MSQFKDTCLKHDDNQVRTSTISFDMTSCAKACKQVVDIHIHPSITVVLRGMASYPLRSCVSGESICSALQFVSDVSAHHHHHLGDHLCALQLLLSEITFNIFQYILCSACSMQRLVTVMSSLNINETLGMWGYNLQ